MVWTAGDAFEGVHAMPMVHEVAEEGVAFGTNGASSDEVCVEADYMSPE